LRQRILHVVGNEQKFSTLRLKHTFGDAVIEEDKKFVVKTINVQKKNRLRVNLESMSG
jgi:hypothetical protein